jgi:hypothetical protein
MSARGQQRGSCLESTVSAGLSGGAANAVLARILNAAGLPRGPAAPSAVVARC